MARCREKHKKDMRYDYEWLMECQLMRIKSPKLYEHLRRSGLMPLPSTKRLRELTAAMSPEFGFNTFGMDSIKKKLAGLPLYKRFVCLTWDEVSISAECKFNKLKLQFDGLMKNYLDLFFDEENDDDGTKRKEAAEKSGSTEVTHALVLMVRSLLPSGKEEWKQPIAVFPAKSAVKGKDLPRIFLKACTALEEVGARVIAFTSDGSQTNVAMWNHFGVFGHSNGLGGKRKKTFKNKIPHPTQDETPIHFLRDAPHEMKCLRNHLLKHGDVLVTTHNF